MLLTLVTALGLFFAGARFVAPEFAGEVVELKTFDAEGRPHETRLWLVEADGALWLRSTAADNGWLERLRAHPGVVLNRPGFDRGPYTARVVAERSATVSEQMARRYGWADALLFLAGDPAAAVAVRLDPAEGPPAVASPAPGP